MYVFSAAAFVSRYNVMRLMLSVADDQSVTVVDATRDERVAARVAMEPVAFQRPTLTKPGKTFGAVALIVHSTP